MAPDEPARSAHHDQVVFAYLHARFSRNGRSVEEAPDVSAPR
jgi:hypothetical protein